MNLDRTQINLSQLRSNQQFSVLMGQLHQELDQARQQYEDNEASEFNRGRLLAIREIIEAIEGNSSSAPTDTTAAPTKRSRYTY